MPYLNADYLTVYAFLLMTLIIGLRVDRRIKNIRAYALANKQFGTIALTLTYLATIIGGTVLGHRVTANLPKKPIDHL